MNTAILGIDGATFPIIDSLNDAELPNIRSLITEGVHGRLRSAFPPVTAPAWVGCATGKNPGKTGIFDFLNRKHRSGLEGKPLNSSEFRRSKSLWHYLNTGGYRVGIWNYPRLFPPYAVDGYMVSGLGASASKEFTYPKDLKKDLFSLCDDYRIHIPYATAHYVDKPDLFVQDCIDLLDQNKKVIDFLLRKDVEVFIGVISATDFA